MLAVATLVPIGSQQAAHASIGSRTYINAQGFDTCLHMSQAQFSDFWYGTPIYMFGTYLGGSGGSCVGCTPIASSTLNYAVGLGLGVVPFYFGVQMGGNCAMSYFPSTISMNTTTAYN